MRRPFSVQVFLIRGAESELSYLILHRNERPELGLPDFWQGISGALEAGETFSAAALREVSEETGIVLDCVTDTGFRHFYPIRPEWRQFYGPEPDVVEERVFYAHVMPSTEAVLSPEHKASRWCTFLEAASSLTFGSNAECLRSVNRALSATGARLRKIPFSSAGARREA